jgi:hypothetical protein
MGRGRSQGPPGPPHPIPLKHYSIQEMIYSPQNMILLAGYDLFELVTYVKEKIDYIFSGLKNMPEVGSRKIESQRC